MRDFKYFIIANVYDAKACEKTTEVANRMIDCLNSGYKIHSVNATAGAVHYILSKMS